MDAGPYMNSSRKLLALLMVVALLLAAFAPAAFAHSAAILVPLCLFSVCLTTFPLRRTFDRCCLPSSPFCPPLASRPPPSR
jgi:hypothetical protein